jgi:aminoglycoside phosphotransferase family enzyme
MKRLKSTCQMHLMLEKKQVTTKHIKALAVLIRNFHTRTEVIHTPFQPDQVASQFIDIRSITGFAGEALGPEYAEIIERAVRVSDTFLQTHQDLFAQRIKEGWVRDGHGDLHSRNIFLCPEPVVFDCIEFNDDLRRMDVLDEIAFFCMDLEAEGFFQLSRVFVQYYFAGRETPLSNKENLLFTYYKCYRANVRAKVTALRAMKSVGTERKKSLDDVALYLDLMKKYLRKFA